MTAPPATSSSNVRVVSRIRPLAKYELEKGCKPVVNRVPNGNPANEGPVALEVTQPEKRYFELDAVLDESCTQKDVYEQSGAYKAISEDLFAGFNCTILAYGQTGAGKTFTMGTAAKTTSGGGLEESAGVIPRACQDLFDNIASKCDSNAHVELSYLEVYNEEIRDLLNSNQQNQSQLRIRETLNGEVYVRGLQARTVSNPADVGRLMEEASGRRVVASTKMNATSSRSHAICVLKIKGVLEDSTKFQSKLTLVDLAGSERIKKTEAKGSRAQEGISINKGLFVLGQVVSALAEQRPKYKRKPPFRDSKLTRLLQDSLGGNSRTIMIACCSPADFNIEETINTLRYATQARNIKNTATANLVQQISQEEAMKLQRENALLKTQIAELQETIRKLTEDVTMEDLHRSVRMIEASKATTGGGGGHTPGLETIPSQSGHELSPSKRTDATPEMEIPPPVPTESDEDDEGGVDDDDDVDDAASDTAAPLDAEKENNDGGGDGTHPPVPKMSKLEQHLSNSGANGDLEITPCDETVSLALEEVMPGGGGAATVVSNVSGKTKKSYNELEEENATLAEKLRQSQRDVRATVTQSAIELPALKVRVMMLEEELGESAALEEETETLRNELEEAKRDRKSAILAAQNLSDFMEKQKSESGFRGDELHKKRLWYFNKRLEEKWVNFVVVMLLSFKEQMRLLGDYFEMVVRVVESKDIVTMLGPKTTRRTWWGGNISRERELAEETDLRNRLLGEHIKFFNARLLEIEDEITNRSEAVEAIMETLGDERREMEHDFDETEFVRDYFSKKGEKLLSHLTELMTGPLFTLPLIPGQTAEA